MINDDEDKDVDDVIIVGEINGNSKEYSNNEDILLIDILFLLHSNQIFSIQSYSFYDSTLSVKQKINEKKTILTSFIDISFQDSFLKFFIV